MRKFDLYEFTGIIVPGTVLLVGVSFCSPAISKVVFEQDLSVGKTAVSLIVAYGLGHLVAALGNLIEKVWWWAWRGWPSDWPRSGCHHLLAAEQLRHLNSAFSGKLGLQFVGDFQQLTSHDWFAVVRQMYATAAAHGAVQRVDIFNGNYGLNRGLAAALIAILAVVQITQGFAHWRAELLLALGVAVAVYRMHRFGVHYARELFVQFLAIGVAGGNTPAESRG